MTPDTPSNDEVDVKTSAARRSLNEIEAMGKRAARGVGLAWGLAEEAGKAARWLTVRGLPGVSLLADVLAWSDRRDYAELTPADVDGAWQAPAGPLCPLITGAALCDRADEIAGGRVFELGETAQPLLLAPYVAGAAKLTGVTMSIAWDNVVITISKDGESIEGDHQSLTARSTKHIHCRRASNDDASLIPVNELAGPAASAVPDATWSRLAALAQRTFAPATEASRLSGAGAGLSDNN